MAKFDVQAALKAGYSQDQINSYIQQNKLTPINVPTATPTQTPVTPTATPSVTTQPTSSPDLATGVGQGALDFLGGLVKAATQPFTNYVDQIGQQRQAISKMTPQQQQDYAQKNLKFTGNPLLDLLSGNVATKMSVKPTLAAASYAVPFGAGGNLLTKVLLPGAAVEGLQGAAEENATPASVTGNALLGAGGAGLLHGVLGLPGLFNGAGQGLETAGNKIIQGQYNVPRSVAQKLGLNDVVSRLANYGVTNIGDVERVAPLVTGDSGILTKLTRQAVGQAGPVNTDGLLQMAQDIAGNPEIQPGQDTKFVQFIKKGLGSLYDSDTPPNMGNPLNVFDFIKTLGKQAASTTNTALANAYRSFADELENRLYSQAGGNVNLQGIVSDPEVLSQLKAISPKLAEDVSGVKTIDELRSLAAPFVRGSQAAKITENVNGNKLLSLSDLAAGLGAGFTGGGPAGGAAAIVGKKVLDSNAGKSTIGGILRGAGNIAKKSQPVQLSNPVNQLLSQIASRNALLSEASNNNTNQAENGSESQSVNNLSNHTNSISQDNNNVNYGSNANGGLKITAQQVAAAQLMLPPMIADRIKAAYQAQFGGLNPADLQAQKGLIAQASDVSNKINQLEGKLGQGSVAVNNLLGVAGKGDTDVQKLQAQLSSLNQDYATTIHRRGMSPDQMKALDDALPQIGKDSPQQLKSKIAAMLYTLQNFYPYSSGSDASATDTTGGTQ